MYFGLGMVIFNGSTIKAALCSSAGQHGLFLLSVNSSMMHEDATPGHAINEPILSSSVKNTPVWMITFSKKQGPVFQEL